MKIKKYERTGATIPMFSLVIIIKIIIIILFLLS